MRSKRLRSSSHGGSGAVSGAAYGYTGDGATPAELLDPSLMTERQQLAFLLRKTAQEASSSAPSSNDDSSSSEGEDKDSDGGSVPRATRPQRRVTKRTKARVAVAATAAASATPVVYCGRGRPPKNSIKLPATGSGSVTKRPRRNSPRSRSSRSTRSVRAATRLADAEADAAKPKALKEEPTATTAKPVSTPATSASCDKSAPPLRLELELAVKREKTSPSSASDVVLLGGGSSSSSSRRNNGSSLTAASAAASSAAPPCALCCNLAPFCDAPLFLCPACDQKYPTQQALGRACMT